MSKVVLGAILGLALSNFGSHACPFLNLEGNLRTSVESPPAGGDFDLVS